MIVLPLVATLLLAGAPPEQADAVRGLATQYADGRRTVTALSTKGRVSWTATFPRIHGADTSRDGLPLFALQFEEALEPSGVAVTVALLYGKPHERRVQVATVHVTGEQPVRVPELEAYGVRPVELSLVPLPLVQLHLPALTAVSSSLEMSAETLADPVPGYRITMVNRGARDVMMIAFKSYRGNAPGAQGRPRGNGHQPLIRAGDSYVLNLSASSRPGSGGAAEWLPIDRVDVYSVLWSDDLVEGDGRVAADEHALTAGTALQLDRLVALLRAAARNPAAQPVAGLRDRVANLTLVVTADEAAAAAATIPGDVRLPAAQVRSTMESGMRNARSAVLNDFDELLKASSSPQASDYAAWLTRLVEKYSGWRSRIRP
jgi:hypothetical protein